MASHNYYGFTHGGTIGQYSGYGVSSAAYSQPASQSSASYAAVGQQQTAQYGPYGDRIQQAYDSQQSSYLSAMDASSSGYGAVALGYGDSTASSKYPNQSAYYQAASAETPSYYTQMTGQKSAPKKTEARVSEWQSFSSSAQKKASQSHPYAVTTSAEMTGLDKALYAIAANYCQSQASQQTGRSGGGGSHPARALWWNKKGKMPVDPSQWKYCELCKMTCPGDQAYKLHLEGKIHKKKEATANVKGSGPAIAAQQWGRSGAFCEVCDVSCSSKDAYEAHIRGIKHQKVVKLMTRMGKVVPESRPATASSVGSALKKTAPGTGAANTSAMKKVYCTPKINFVGGTQLKTTGGGQIEEVSVKREGTQPGSVAYTTAAASSTQQSAFEEGEIEPDTSVQPIGMEYIEEGMNDAGTAPSFFCKLCDCHFTDVMGKSMHAKGRRHRLAYKKKVDPSLKVDMKVNAHDRRAVLEKLKRNRSIPEQWRKRELEATYRMEAEELRYEKEVLEWKLQEAAGSRYAPAPLTTSIWAGRQPGIGPQPVFNGTIERALQAKHVSIYPSMQELGVVQKMVAAVEKSLKLVSDQLAVHETKPQTDETPADKTDSAVSSTATAAGQARMMKGVMRVGLLCKGLLLRGHLNLHLVVLCAEKPTKSLIGNIAELLPAQLASAMDEELELTTDGCDIYITRKTEPYVICAISLTSAAVKSDGSEEASDPVDMLDRDKCIQLLAELRHAKWFQAKVTPMPTYLVVIRLLMEYCCREPAWSPLSQWALELLVEKCAASLEGGNKSASSILLRVFECIASGLLLEEGPGIYDVCEKEPTDAMMYMTAQQREDITYSAQHTVRQLLFGQADQVFPVVKPEPVAAEAEAEVSSVSAGSDAATDSQCKRPRISSA